MPRDTSGNFTLDAGYLAVDGETIRASQHNPPLQDIATGLSQSLARTGVGGMLGPLPMNNNKVTMLAAGAAADEGVNKGQMDTAIASAVDALDSDLTAQITAIGLPAGAVSAFARQTAPAGWLICNGALVSRITYAALFAAIGTTFGTGDGTTTFGLPDLRGEFIRGFDAGRGADPARTFGVSQTDAFKSHNHTGVTNTVGDHIHLSGDASARGDTRYGQTSTGTAVYASQYGSPPQTAEAFNSSPAGSHSHTITSEGASETRPRNVAMLFCIKI